MSTQQSNNNNGSSNNKDPMVLFKGADLRKNKKGGDYLTLKLSPESLVGFIELLQSNVTERGVKLDVHVSDKETEDGRTFKSAIAFVKGIQEFGAARSPRGGSASASAAGTSPVTKSAIEKLKSARS